MSSGQSPAPPEGVAHGPVIPDGETLFRAITTPAWWVEEENRPSSAAFKQDYFSVDIARLIDHDPSRTAARFGPGTGVVSLTSEGVKAAGADPRHEPDPDRPDDPAHAHVYTPPAGRKAVARKLAAIAIPLLTPSFS